MSIIATKRLRGLKKKTSAIAYIHTTFVFCDKIMFFFCFLFNNSKNKFCESLGHSHKFECHTRDFFLSALIAFFTS